MPRRTLTVIRHAKADEGEGMTDRDRPLTEKGERDAAGIAAVPGRAAWPDLVLCSPATRTRQTGGLMEAAVVRTGPAETTLTRTPRGPRSRAR